MMGKLKTDLVVVARAGLECDAPGRMSAGQYHKANLIPRICSTNQPDVYQPYLILREHVIDRLYDQNVGYWQPDLQGMEHLTVADRAELFVDYLGLSERELVKAVEHMVTDALRSNLLADDSSSEAASSYLRRRPCVPLP